MIYFLGAILALLPVYLIRFQIAGLPTTFLEILIVVFLFAVLIKIDKNDLKKISSLGKINYAVLGFILAGIISTIISPEKARALGQLKAFIVEPVLLFYASVLIIKSKEQLDLVLRFLLAGVAAVAAFGILQYYTYINLPLKFWGTGEELKRITAFFEHPNALALYLAPLTCFYFTLWLKKYDLRLKKLLPLALVLMFWALTLTFSRGAWLAVLAVIAFLVFRQFGIKKIIPLVLLCTALLLVPAVRQRVTLGFSDQSSQVHIELWKLGIERVLQNPILGTGLHNFKAFTVEYPHNIFLNFWVEMGLLGLLSFGAVVILAWQRQKNRPTDLTLAAGIFLLVLILHGLVDMPYFKNDLSVLFWFMISVFYIDHK